MLFVFRPGPGRKGKSPADVLSQSWADINRPRRWFHGRIRPNAASDDPLHLDNIPSRIFPTSPRRNTRTKAWLGWIVIGAVPFLQVGTLAPSDVRAITQHHEGFVWFGLQLGGLTRYDGYELKVCGNTPTIPPT